MPLPRKRLIDLLNPGWVHCISRCVRRAFLAGDRFAHRKDWVEQRLEYLSKVYACEIAAFSVMSNHVHVVVRMAPEVARAWSAEMVAERWFAVFPAKYRADGTPVPPPAATVRAFASDPQWVAQKRQRLSDLPWFMRSLNEHIARLANREDECSGRFWEGRYTSVPLLDQAALIACMAYVDLNPVRARLAETPETSAHTAVLRRARARTRFRAATEVRARDPARAAKLLAKGGLDPDAVHAEHGLWLCPLERCIVGEPLANWRITPDEYLTLVDATGRIVRAGKRGSIPPELAPILARLELTVEAWVSSMLLGGWRGTAWGSAASRAAEAARRGWQWVKCRCAVFAEPAA